MIAAAICALLPAVALGQSAAENHAACRDAGTAAEHAMGVPPGLLLAIGRVESGRRDPSTGIVSAWPWTLNAAGTGQVFGTAEQAQAATRSWQASGVASIDVGCFQVNLLHHPAAFTSLDQAFDPTANAAYAGRFLSSLRTKLGSWDAAVAAYHSATPERGGPYRDRVMAGWTGAALPSAEPLQAPRPAFERVLAWSPPAPASGMRIWTPSQPGMAPGIITLQVSRPALQLASRR